MAFRLVEDATDRLWALYGSTALSILEEYAGAGHHVETETITTVEGMRMSGLAILSFTPSTSKIIFGLIAPSYLYLLVSHLEKRIYKCMAKETYEKWELIEGITTPAAFSLVKDDRDGLTVTLVFSAIIDGIDTNLQIKFGRVPAYTVHEEFSHPWMNYETETAPMLNGRWDNYAFPTLIVKDSRWLNSFTDVQLLGFDECTHYQLRTLDKTVDVLCDRVPEVSWVEPKIEI